MKLNYTDAIKRYGAIVNGKWDDESKWCVSYKPPQWFSSQVVNSATGMPCLKIYLNKDLVDPLNKALELLYSRGLSKELKTFDGCFHIRNIRGSNTEQSMHSWACALDFNAHDNPLGGPVTFSKEFLDCFREAGFTCGADFKRVDGMHVSLGF